MDFVLFLSIAGFAVAIGGFVLTLTDSRGSDTDCSHPVVSNRRQWPVISVAMTLLILTGLSVYSTVIQRADLDRIEAQILRQLGSDRLTFSGIYQRLNFTEYSLVNEALHRAVAAGSIDQVPILVRDSDGRMITVRIYFKKALPKQ